MSIGFCTDVAETDAASRAFTVVHILLGASCVGGALVLLVQSVLEGVASREASVYRLILEVDSFKKAFMSGSRSDSGSGASYNWLSKKEKGVLSYPDFRQVLNDNGLPELTNREYQRICSFYDPHTEGCIRYERFAQNFEGVRRILPMTRFVHHGSFPWPILARTWDAAYSLFTNEHHRIYLIFVLWIGMGVTWGIVDQGWDPITATHFAVSALATGGLTAPPVDPTTGILPTGPALFCGFYCLFGIPLMALTLGIFAAGARGRVHRRGGASGDRASVVEVGVHVREQESVFEGRRAAFERLYRVAADAAGQIEFGIVRVYEASVWDFGLPALLAKERGYRLRVWMDELEGPF
eukprot:CAMPEP_0196132366 /NCGR_PEP_ID=MMETSP0910-20130528/2023_1 /TAXON_ID=49265 /ORGANISM="Thalassiosira rotula, Strain GSO102" /LENGTH=352 /DNA_ID=CAMNT_0041391973 /DNA_START=2082 /DNA_END=3139 /DNA_ORIENTATION=-